MEIKMNILRIFVLYTFSNVLISVAIAATVERIYKNNNQPAIKGASVQLVCEVSSFSYSDTVELYKTDSRVLSGNSEALTRCRPLLCSTTGIGRYTFATGNSNVYIHITELNRSEDQKWWTCEAESQRKDIYLTIYTIPQTLQFDSPPSQDQDLAINAVTISCSTGCVYPEASFKWFFTESGGSRQEWSTSGNVTIKTGECTDSESIYTSTLSLARYTTFPGNLEQTVKLTCGITTFPGMALPLYTNPSVNVQFAVSVTNVTLKDGVSTPSEPLQVTSGVSKTLTCTTSASRPTATVVWYIGTVEKQRSSSSNSFTFNPQNSDHNKQIFCKAFNTQPESRAVFSTKASLYVQVSVTNVTLKDGESTPSEPLQVTSGVSKTLTCTPSVSRPTATVVWYIGTVEKQRSSSSNSFTFTPQNSDHNKQIFCKAFNMQPESQAVSSIKASLYVQVSVTNVTLKDGDSTPSEPLQVTSGVSKTLTCTTSASRPTATVVWYIGTVEKQRSSSSNSFTFTPQNSDHNEQIFCKAFNTQPESRAVFSTKASLYVQVQATTPNITNQTKGSRIMLEKDIVVMECLSSPTRPTTIVTWRKGIDLLTNVLNTIRTTVGGLLSVRSRATFTPTRNDNNKSIYCETAIPGQQDKAVSQQKITVYWPPSTPFIPVTELPFLENQTGKSLKCTSTGYGNPASEALWESNYGTQDNSNSRILNLPALTSEINNSPVSCQLNNHFTQAKGLQVKSPTISVVVEYNPVVQILEDGKKIQTASIKEGKNFKATCGAVGNPIPTVRWLGQTPDSAELRFNDIDRTDHGTYTCRAQATSTKNKDHNFVTQKNLIIVVYYDQPIETTGNSALIGGVVGGIVALVLIVLVVAGLLFVRRHWAKTDQKTKDDTDANNENNVYMDLQLTETYVNTSQNYDVLQSNNGKLHQVDDSILYENLKI